MYNEKKGKLFNHVQEQKDATNSIAKGHEALKAAKSYVNNYKGDEAIKHALEKDYAMLEAVMKDLDGLRKDFDKKLDCWGEFLTDTGYTGPRIQ